MRKGERYYPLTPAYFAERVAVDPDSGCWNWLLWIGRDGYGCMKINRRNRAAHRVAWELFRGPIPEGLQVDHLCRNRACCNPDHLEPVTPAVNVNRAPGTAFKLNAEKTHCKRGHEFTPENTYRWRDTRNRQCRQCVVLRQKSAKERRAARREMEKAS